MAAKQTRPIEVFFSYSHKDKRLRDRLETQLIILEREGIISSWHDHKIFAGEEWKGQIDEHLKTAQIILLLVSPDFISSDYCYDIEMKQALERHELGSARVIPIILRHTDWKRAPFGKLQALPEDGKPVTSWSSRDEAFLDIGQGIRKVVKELEEKANERDRLLAATKAGAFQLSLDYEIELLRSGEEAHLRYYPPRLRSELGLARLYGIPDINPETVPRRERLKLWYYINNKLDIEVPVWLGAHLRTYGDTAGYREYFDIQEDRKVVLQPGDTTYHRYLTIKNDWPVGMYQLVAAVWYGIRAGPQNSINLTSYFISSSILRIT
jgi:hypothetical protein